MPILLVMLKVQILQIGETKDANLKALEAEYEKRLQPYMKLESLSLPACKKDDRSTAREEERKLFEAKLDPKAVLVVLDESGKELTSEIFAQGLEKIRDFEGGSIQFLIGGSHGLHPSLLERAKLTLSLSKMTFTHEMVRVFLKEQLYRACMILAGKTYHK